MYKSIKTIAIVIILAMNYTLITKISVQLFLYLSSVNKYERDQSRGSK
jgi:hypothetical protein